MIKFTELFKDCTSKGRKIKKEDYLQTGQYPIIDQGQEQIAGFSNEKEGLFVEVPAIIFGDHTRIIKIIDKPFFLGADGVKVLRCKKDNANYKYLYYALKNARIPNTGYNRHYKWLKEIEIIYHDIIQQDNIVSVLDNLYKVIKNRKHQLKKYDDLIKSRFVEMFGDPVSNSKGLTEYKLTDIGKLGRGVSKHRPRNAPELLGGKYPLIQTGDVANADLYVSKYESTYSELGLKQSKLWNKGTLCITIAANIAKTALLSFDACFPDSIVGFCANDMTNNIYIHYWFSFFQSIIEAQAPESAQKNINLKILNELKVIIPTMEEQNAFVDFVKLVDKLKFVMRVYCILLH